MARILAVDDEAISLLLTEVILRKAGHEVATCLSATEAAMLLERTHFDALVLDLNMPGTSGLEALRDLRRRAGTRDLPVLILSSRDSGTDRVRGLREGADDYLVKPVDRDELLLRIEKMVAARSARGALSGQLETYPIVGLLQTLSRTRRSGTVLMISGERSAEVHLLAGRVVGARAGGLDGEEAMIAALDFVRGQFRFFEGEPEGAADGSEGLDGSALVLRHAWLLDDLAQAGALPAADQLFEWVSGSAPQLPPELASPAVEELVERLGQQGPFSWREAEEMEIAAPLTVVALLHHLISFGAVRPAPVQRPEELEASTLRLHRLLARLFEVVRRERSSLHNLHLLLLASPATWSGLVDLVRRLPAELNQLEVSGLDEVERRRGGSWVLQHQRGPVSLHLGVLEPGALRKALQVLPMCAGALLWVEQSSELAFAAPLLEAVEGSAWGQVGAVFGATSLPLQASLRWRALSSPPADLAAALAALVPE